MGRTKTEMDYLVVKDLTVLNDIQVPAGADLSSVLTGDIDLTGNVTISGDLALTGDAVISGTATTFSGPVHLAGDHTHVTSASTVLSGTSTTISGSAILTGGLTLGATLLSRTAAEMNLLTQGVAAGYKIARGVHSTTSAADTKATGLATVVAALASLSSDPTTVCSQVTCQIGNQSGSPVAGSIYIKTWMHTTSGSTAGDPTLVAASGSAVSVNWIAIGT